MTKRGQAIPTSLFILFELILVIFAGVIIFNQIDNIKDGGIFHKKFFAPDIALLISTIQQVEGNLYYLYNPPETSLNKFDYDFKESEGTNFVYVNQERYPFATNRDIKPFFTTLQKPSMITITKQGNNLIFKDTKNNPNYLALDCSKYKENQITELTLDPGHGYNKKTQEGDKGFETKSEYESEININIANTIKTFIPTIVRGSTRDLKTDDDIKDEDRISAIKTPAVLSIHIGSDIDTKTNNVKAYVNFHSTKKQESMFFACNILNKLSEKIPLITGTAIVPVDVSVISKDDARHILLPNRVAVQLEIGNIQNKVNNFITKDQTKIANAIKEALNE